MKKSTVLAPAAVIAAGIVALNVVGNYLVGPMDYTGAEAAIIVIAATETMCPDAIPAVQQQIARADSQLA
jgi:hypothetical protein